MASCKCVKCGGTDKNTVCENTMYALKGAVYIQEKFGVWLFVIALLIASCGMFGLFD